MYVTENKVHYYTFLCYINNARYIFCNNQSRNACYIFFVLYKKCNNQRENACYIFLSYIKNVTIKEKIHVTFFMLQK
ncbi:hypothetical protein HanIR_Chr15g0743641 [Helianthus annuus]|nr:hypothetical protein HanIR_Chr15g0743641 [Helianthus annuus]